MRPPLSLWIALSSLSSGAGCAGPRLVRQADMRDPASLVGSTVELRTAEGRTEAMTVTRVEGTAVIGHRPWEAASAARAPDEIRFELIDGVARPVGQSDAGAPPLAVAPVPTPPPVSAFSPAEPRPRRFRALLGAGGGSASAANVTFGAGVTLGCAGSIAVSLNGIIGIDATGEEMNVAGLVGADGRVYHAATVRSSSFTTEIEIAHRRRSFETWGSVGVFWGTASADVTYDGCTDWSWGGWPPFPSCGATGPVEGSDSTGAAGGLAFGAGIRALVAGPVTVGIEVRHQLEAAARFDEMPAVARIGGTSVTLGLGFGFGSSVAERERTGR